MGIARQYEVDLFADTSAGVPATSDSIDLFSLGMSPASLSIQAVYDVQAPTAKTFDSGGAEIDTFTFPDFATIAAGDYMVVYDTAGLAWAAAADKSGSDPEPTGDIWVAIPAARKVMVDLSGAIVTAADVATAFEAALNALVDVPITFADSTADVVATGDLYGVVEAPEVHNEDDSGAGTISVVVTDAGVASEVDVAESTITIPSHAYTDGLLGRLTTTGTLPAPFLVATDYFVIVVDANTIQLAASQADALAGTFIEITDQGSDEAVNTFTMTALAGATVTFQASNDATNWTALATATTITVDGSVFQREAVVNFRYVRAVKALTAGQVDLACHLLVVGPSY